MKMKRVMCLYRVSTRGQVDKQDDIPMQRRHNPPSDHSAPESDLRQFRRQQEHLQPSSRVLTEEVSAPF